MRWFNNHVDERSVESRRSSPERVYTHILEADTARICAQRRERGYSLFWREKSRTSSRCARPVIRRHSHTLWMVPVPDRAWSVHRHPLHHRRRMAPIRTWQMSNTVGCTTSRRRKEDSAELRSAGRIDHRGDVVGPQDAWRLGAAHRGAVRQRGQPTDAWPAVACFELSRHQVAMRLQLLLDANPCALGVVVRTPRAVPPRPTTHQGGR